jgi:hypothetical protein
LLRDRFVRSTDRSIASNGKHWIQAFHSCEDPSINVQVFLSESSASSRTKCSSMSRPLGGTNDFMLATQVKITGTGIKFIYIRMVRMHCCFSDLLCVFQKLSPRSVVEFGTLQGVGHGDSSGAWRSGEIIRERNSHRQEPRRTIRSVRIPDRRPPADVVETHGASRVGNVRSEPRPSGRSTSD